MSIEKLAEAAAAEVEKVAKEAGHDLVEAYDKVIAVLEHKKAVAKEFGTVPNATTEPTAPIVTTEAPLVSATPEPETEAPSPSQSAPVAAGDSASGTSEVAAAPEVEPS